MRVAMIGTGYVGLVSGACFADFGHDVTCVDKDTGKIAALTVTVLAFSYLTMPLWWWAIDDPSKQYATLNLGIYTVTSTSLAFLTTGLGLVLVPVAALVNRAAAAGHARMATRLLAPAGDGEARHHPGRQVFAA